MNKKSGFNNASLHKKIKQLQLEVEKLKYQNEKYRQIFHSTSEAIFVHSAETGEIIEVNDAFTRIFNCQKEEVKNLTVEDLSAGEIPYTQKEAINHIKNAYNIGPQLFEWRSKTKDGKVFWSEVSLKVLAIEDEKLVVAVVRNIEKRKQRELLRKKEKEFLRVIFDSSPAFHVAINSHGNIMMMNKAMLNILDYEEDEVIEKNYLEMFIPKDEHELLETVFKKLIVEKKSTVNSNHVLSKSGKKHLVEWQGRPLLDFKGEFEILIGMGIEVTDKKLAEIRIRESEEKYRLLFETAGDAIFLMDDQIFIDCNAKTLEIFECTREQIIGKPPYEYSPELQLDGRKSLDKAIEKIEAAKNGEPQLFEWKHKKYNGQVFDAEVSLNLLHISNKDYILAIVRDISERKEINNQISKLNIELEKRADELEIEIKEKTKHESELKIQNEHIAKLNQDLIFALERSEQSDKLKTAFLANMSHEVRTPLNAVLGFSELLDDDTLESDKREYYLGIIKSSGNQLLILINDIIDISKIEAGIIELAKSKININNLFDEIALQLEGMKERHQKEQLEIIVDKGLSDEKAVINLDEVRFRQILLNLLENAIKFTFDGSITYGYKLIDGKLEFYVKDTGIGISKNKQSYIFERFRQLELSATRRFGGTGLGLSIAKALVEMFHGDIWLESTEGKGTTFFFTIPYKSENQKIEKPVKEIELPIYDWNRKTILVVEDEQVNYLYINELLFRTQVNILHAKDGLEALEFVKNNPNISLILMDIRLPNMDGFMAIERILKMNKRVPIIAQTAFASDEDRAKCLEAGCVDYLSKPIKTNTLLLTISKYI
jgi:PAS domain S-box-containing protein